MSTKARQPRTFALERAFISCFVVVTLSTVVYMNFMGFFRREVEQAIKANTDPYIYSMYEYVNWRIATLAYIAGLDNRWEMYSTLPRFNWRFVFKAKYSDQHTVTLPLAGQTERTFLQNTFFDFKEAKFRWNIYSSSANRQPYIQYLCRTFPLSNGAYVKSIILELYVAQI